ncbi:MAG: rod shape-determining protein MreC [Candidatus Handelsmanbacteria bacterium]|nr:rod shape-determining protein MreC [Candidatus Handelsmanbacteria bacterium]
MAVNRNFLAIGLALIVAISLMGLNPAQKAEVGARLQLALGAVGQWIFSPITRFASANIRNRFVMAQNVELALENMRFREAAWENRRLREALGFKREMGGSQIIPAEVISRDPDQLYDALVINAGRQQGVLEGMPVVVPDGLVGHVLQTEDHSAVVALIMSTRISAIVQEKRVQGIVSWGRGSLFRLNFVDVTSDIEKGDRVVSSGLGGRFPKGLVIGDVIEVRQQKRDPLFKEVFVETNVNFGKLEEVFVISSAN